MNIEWKLFGKVVHGPILIAFSFVMTVVLTFGAIVLSPALVPLHFLLRRFGRNGFYFNKHIEIGKDSFARA